MASAKSTASPVPRLDKPTHLKASAFNAFQLTIVSAPANSCSIDFMMVFTRLGEVYSLRATAPITSSGVVTLPFSMLGPLDGYPVDLTRLRGVELEFRGNQSPVGTTYFLHDEEGKLLGEYLWSGRGAAGGAVGRRAVRHLGARGLVCRQRTGGSKSVSEPRPVQCTVRAW